MVSQRMAASFGIECPDGVVDGLIEVAWSGEGLVSEVMPLQVAPETLDIVQLRSVFRQPLDPEPMSPLGEGRPSRLTGVDGAVVEHKHDRLEHAAEPDRVFRRLLILEGWSHDQAYSPVFS